MKYINYNVDGYNCVERSLAKILNIDCEEVRNNLEKIKEELNASNSNDIEVFEEYMNRNSIFALSDKIDSKIKDLKLDNGEYIVFCYDKKDFYHMVPIIDNTLYDKSDKSFDLYTIKIYRNVSERVAN